jgi:hypothetical protein
MKEQQAAGTLSLCNFGLSGAKYETDWGCAKLSKSSTHRIKTYSYTVGTLIALNAGNNAPSVGSEMLTIQHGCVDKGGA